jgi:hypothetical protein
MDYKTVIRCYLEMKSNGAYAADVSELLIEEVDSSNDFLGYERVEMLQKVREWQIADEIDKPDIMAAIEDRLQKRSEFQDELAKAVAHRLNGGSINNF